MTALAPKLTIKKAKTLLKCSRATAQRRLAEAKKYYNSIHITEEMLDAFIKNRAKQP